MKEGESKAGREGEEDLWTCRSELCKTQSCIKCSSGCSQVHLVGRTTRALEWTGSHLVMGELREGASPQASAHLLSKLSALLHGWAGSPTPSMTLKKLEAVPFGGCGSGRRTQGIPDTLPSIEHRHVYWELFPALSRFVRLEALEGCLAADLSVP